MAAAAAAAYAADAAAAPVRTRTRRKSSGETNADDKHSRTALHGSCIWPPSLVPCLIDSRFPFLLFFFSAQFDIVESPRIKMNNRSVVDAIYHLRSNYYRRKPRMCVDRTRVR